MLGSERVGWKGKKRMGAELSLLWMMKEGLMGWEERGCRY
jgi:hypothetical protein